MHTEHTRITGSLNSVSGISGSTALLSEYRNAISMATAIASSVSTRPDAPAVFRHPGEGQQQRPDAGQHGEHAGPIENAPHGLRTDVGKLEIDRGDGDDAHRQD